MLRLKLNDNLKVKMNKLIGAIRGLVYCRAIKDNFNTINMTKFKLTNIGIKHRGDKVRANPDDWNDYNFSSLNKLYRIEDLEMKTILLNDDSYWINGNYYLSNSDVKRLLQEFEVPAETFKLYVDQMREVEEERIIKEVEEMCNGFEA